jgi:hypothetical protein
MLTELIAMIVLVELWCMAKAIERYRKKEGVENRRI